MIICWCQQPQSVLMFAHNVTELPSYHEARNRSRYTLTESDAFLSGAKRKSAQPYRGPGGLSFGCQVDQYKYIWPILQKLEPQSIRKPARHYVKGVCATLKTTPLSVKVSTNVYRNIEENFDNSSFMHCIIKDPTVRYLICYQTSNFPEIRPLG